MIESNKLQDIKTFEESDICKKLMPKRWDNKDTENSILFVTAPIFNEINRSMGIKIDERYTLDHQKIRSEYTFVLTKYGQMFVFEHRIETQRGEIEESYQFSEIQIFNRLRVVIDGPVVLDSLQELASLFDTEDDIYLDIDYSISSSNSGTELTFTILVVVNNIEFVCSAGKTIEENTYVSITENTAGHQKETLRKVVARYNVKDFVNQVPTGHPEKLTHKLRLVGKDD